MAKRAGSTVVEVKGSHAIYFSQLKAVAALIGQAAKKVKAAWLRSSRASNERQRHERVAVKFLLTR